MARPASLSAVIILTTAPSGTIGGKIHLDPVECGGHGRLGQAGTDGLGELHGRRSLVELLG